MLYFAYGSNLDERQMARRCPAARVYGPAVLPQHALCFTGFSPAWGGAVASIKELRNWQTQGVLYMMSASDLRALDTFEGHPHVYRRALKTVVTEDGRRVQAQVYVHREASTDVPGPNYLAVIRRAYKHHGFDGWALKIAALGDI